MHRPGAPPAQPGAAPRTGGGGGGGTAPSKEVVKLVVACAGADASSLLVTHWPGDPLGMLAAIQAERPAATLKSEWKRLREMFDAPPPPPPPPAAATAAQASSSSAPRTPSTSARALSPSSITRGLGLAQRELLDREQKAAARERALEGMRQELDLHETRLVRKEEQLQARAAQHAVTAEENEQLRRQLREQCPRHSATQTVATSCADDLDAGFAERVAVIVGENRALLQAERQAAAAAAAQHAAEAADLEARLTREGRARDTALQEAAALRDEVARHAEQLDAQARREAERAADLRRRLADATDRAAEAEADAQAAQRQAAAERTRHEARAEREGAERAALLRRLDELAAAAAAAEADGGGAAAAAAVREEEARRVRARAEARAAAAEEQLAVAEEEAATLRGQRDAAERARRRAEDAADACEQDAADRETAADLAGAFERREALLRGQVADLQGRLDAALGRLQQQEVQQAQAETQTQESQQQTQEQQQQQPLSDEAVTVQRLLSEASLSVDRFEEEGPQVQQPGGQEPQQQRTQQAPPPSHQPSRPPMGWLSPLPSAQKEPTTAQTVTFDAHSSVRRVYYPVSDASPHGAVVAPPELRQASDAVLEAAAAAAATAAAAAALPRPPQGAGAALLAAHAAYQQQLLQQHQQQHQQQQTSDDGAVTPDAASPLSLRSASESLIQGFRPASPLASPVGSRQASLLQLHHDVLLGGSSSEEHAWPAAGRASPAASLHSEAASLVNPKAASPRLAAVPSPQLTALHAEASSLANPKAASPRLAAAASPITSLHSEGASMVNPKAASPRLSAAASPITSLHSETASIVNPKAASPRLVATASPITSLHSEGASMVNPKAASPRLSAAASPITSLHSEAVSFANPKASSPRLAAEASPVVGPVSLMPSEPCSSPLLASRSSSSAAPQQPPGTPVQLRATASEEGGVAPTSSPADEPLHYGSAGAPTTLQLFASSSAVQSAAEAAAVTAAAPAQQQPLQSSSSSSSAVAAAAASGATLESCLAANEQLQRRLEDALEEKAATKRTLMDCLRANRDSARLMTVESRFEASAVEARSLAHLLDLHRTEALWTAQAAELSAEAEAVARAADAARAAALATTAAASGEEAAGAALLVEEAETRCCEVYLAEADSLRDIVAQCLVGGVQDLEAREDAAAREAYTSALRATQASEAVARRGAALEEVLAAGALREELHMAVLAAQQREVERLREEGAAVAARGARAVELLRCVEELLDERTSGLLLSHSSLSLRRPPLRSGTEDSAAGLASTAASLDEAAAMAGAVAAAGGAGALVAFCRQRVERPLRLPPTLPEEGASATDVELTEEEGDWSEGGGGEWFEVRSLAAAKVQALEDGLSEARGGAARAELAQREELCAVLRAELEEQSAALHELTARRTADEHVRVLEGLATEAYRATLTLAHGEQEARLRAGHALRYTTLELQNVALDAFNALTPADKASIADAIARDCAAALSVPPTQVTAVAVTPSAVQRTMSFVLAVSPDAAGTGESPYELCRRFSDKKAAGRILTTAGECAAKELKCMGQKGQLTLLSTDFPVPSLPGGGSSAAGTPLSASPHTPMEPNAPTDDAELAGMRAAAAAAAAAASLDASHAEKLAGDWLAAYEAALRWEKASQEAHRKLDEETEEVKRLQENVRLSDKKYLVKEQECVKLQEKYDCSKRVAEEDLRRTERELTAELCNAAETVLRIKIMHSLAVEEVGLMTSEIERLQKEFIECKTAVHVADQTLADVYRDLEIQKVARADGIRQLADDCRRVASELHGAQAEARRYTELLEESKGENATLAQKLENLKEAHDTQTEALQALQGEKAAVDEQRRKQEADAERVRQLLQKSRDKLQDTALETMNMRTALSTTLENARQKELITASLTGEKDKLLKQQGNYAKEVDKMHREKVSAVGQMQQELDGLVRQLNKAMGEAKGLTESHQKIKESNEKLAEQLKQQREKADRCEKSEEEMRVKCDAAVAEMEAAVARKATAETELAELQTKFDDEVGRLTRSVERYEAEVAELSKQGAEQGTATAQLQAKVRELTAELEELQHTSAAELRGFEDLRERAATFDDELRAAVEERDGLRRELEAVVKEGVQLREEADAAERARLTEENARLKEDLEAAEASGAMRRKECEDLRQEMIAQSYELQGVSDAARAAKDRSTEAGASLRQERAAADAAKARGERLVSQVDAEQQRVNELVERLGFAEAEGARLQGELTKTEGELEQTRQALQEASKEHKMEDLLNRAEELAALSAKELKAKLGVEGRLREEAEEALARQAALSAAAAHRFLAALVEKETECAQLQAELNVLAPLPPREQPAAPATLEETIVAAERLEQQQQLQQLLLLQQQQEDVAGPPRPGNLAGLVLPPAVPAASQMLLSRRE